MPKASTAAETLFRSAEEDNARVRRIGQHDLISKASQSWHETYGAMAESLKENLNYQGASFMAATAPAGSQIYTAANLNLT